MAAKFLIFFGLLTFSQVYGLQVNSDGKIKIKVLTSAGCSDTVTFIPDHLAQAYSLYGDYLDVEFVPWGKSTWDGVGDIVCQFGVNDCWANRLHRCVLNMLKDNQAAQVHYMTCEFTTPFPSYLQGSYLCAQAVGVNLIEVDHCVSNDHDDLDRAAQAASAEAINAFNTVPSIVFNDSVDEDLHNTALVRLTSMICFALAADPSTSVIGCQI